VKRSGEQGLDPTPVRGSSAKAKPGLWVSFHIDDDEYWVRVPRERIERQIALRWLGWGGFVLALSLLAAYFLVPGSTAL